MNIAIYGKGGIGKSTITTCLSVLLATNGAKVLQVGCDPKHDSTLSLLDGKTIVTMIDSLDKTDMSDDKIIVEGIHGIDCVEMGGPEPGVGCAGRGIIAGLQKLEKLNKYKEKEYDHIIYDVLGDVVCGGFFQPLKSKKVDKVYIITSGEFNSIFAANNLCKGYKNCNLEGKGIALSGIIGNCRGIQREKEIIQEFSKRTNVPLVAIIPRDERIEKCTIMGTNVIDNYVGKEVNGEIQKIVNNIEDPKEIVNVKTLSLEEIRNMYVEVVG